MRLPRTCSDPMVSATGGHSNTHRHDNRLRSLPFQAIAGQCPERGRSACCPRCRVNLQGAADCADRCPAGDVAAICPEGALTLSICSSSRGPTEQVGQLPVFNFGVSVWSCTPATMPNSRDDSQTGPVQDRRAQAPRLAAPMYFANRAFTAGQANCSLVQIAITFWALAFAYMNGEGKSVTMTTGVFFQTL